MAGPALLAAKAALLLSDERARKRIGYAAAAVFVPLVLVVAFLLSLLSGTTQHNNAAVDLVFNGGPVPTTMSAEYTAQVYAMQDCLAALDNAVAEVNSQMESGTLDGAMVKATFFSLCFGGENPHLSGSEARAFVDCFVRYETRTRTVTNGTDPDTGETEYTEETYTVAIALDLVPVHGPGHQECRGSGGLCDPCVGIRLGLCLGDLRPDADRVAL